MTNYANWTECASAITGRELTAYETRRGFVTKNTATPIICVKSTTTKFVIEQSFSEDYSEYTTIQEYTTKAATDTVGSVLTIVRGDVTNETNRVKVRPGQYAIRKIEGQYTPEVTYLGQYRLVSIILNEDNTVTRKFNKV